MKGISLYFIITMLTGNPLVALIVILLLYGAIDRAFLGFLPDFTAPFKRNRRIKSLSVQLYQNPANATAALELGVLYFEKKKYTKALENFRKAYDKMDDSARLHLYKGMTLMELQQPEDGKQALEKAVELDRKVGYGLPFIYLLRFWLKHPSEDSSDRIRELEDCFEHFANTENFYRMGMIYKQAGDKAKARQMFEHSIRDYSYCPRYVRKLHRRWALMSRIRKLTLGR